MRTSNSIFSTAAALNRVFVLPVKQLHYQSAIQNLPRPRLAQGRAILLQARSATSSSSSSHKKRLPRDDEIKSWSVRLVDEDGKLSEPMSTVAVLMRLDRHSESLIVVDAGEPGDPPICKVMNKKAMRDTEKARAKALRNTIVGTKEIELNWAIDKNDLGHRLNKIREFLTKGLKVEILVAPKRKGKGRQATVEEAQALVDKLVGLVDEVEGAKQSRDMDGKLLGQLKFFAEGKAPQK